MILASAAGIKRKKRLHEKVENVLGDNMSTVPKYKIDIPKY